MSRKLSGMRAKPHPYAWSLVQVHIAVFFLGLSSLSAKLSNQSALSITFARVWISAPVLFLYHRLRGMPLKLNGRRDYGFMVVLGALWAVHWVTFFQSVKVSTVAIATITFAAYPVFVTFLEPWLFRETLRPAAIAEAMLMLVGASITVPWQADSGLLSGFLWGMFASALHAVIVLTNRRMVRHYAGETVAFYSQASAALLLLPAALMDWPVFSGRDWAVVLGLSLLCSALAQTLVGRGLKRVKAQTVALIGGLESVYGIFFAALLLGESPSIRECLGGAIVLGVSLYATLKKRRQPNQAAAKVH